MIEISRIKTNISLCMKPSFMHLARISREVSTAAAQKTISTALRLLRLLDILSSMSAGSLIARLVSTALCTAPVASLTRNPVRKAG